MAVVDLISFNPVLVEINKKKPLVVPFCDVSYVQLVRYLSTHKNERISTTIYMKDERHYTLNCLEGQQIYDYWREYIRRS